eukprot:CAMPEP_0115413826 /NCGR_PEP_ID=MMETSP0271-20121206/22273_1 /TAXON_ID=71861 /ORGANISM="Scrippsiella trochoidea, Strain CCMP3099" /LENGTH=286 /DNA_ID=CAMNT_0002838123 /DNA_START=44 /DNA_END=904 /DNA_ORIENTATION=+
MTQRDSLEDLTPLVLGREGSRSTRAGAPLRCGHRLTAAALAALLGVTAAVVISARALGASRKPPPMISMSSGAHGSRTVEAASQLYGESTETCGDIVCVCSWVRRSGQCSAGSALGACGPCCCNGGVSSTASAVQAQVSMILTLLWVIGAALLIIVAIVICHFWPQSPPETPRPSAATEEEGGRSCAGSGRGCAITTTALAGAATVAAAATPAAPAAVTVAGATIASLCGAASVDPGELGCGGRGKTEADVGGVHVNMDEKSAEASGACYVPFIGPVNLSLRVCPL